MNLIRLASLVVCAAMLSACATRPPIEPASERLGMAKAALEQARVSDADDLAPVLYRQAESKITQAEQAIRDGNAATGERLAYEAMLEARLARLQADRADQQELLDEIQAGIDALEEELSTRD